MLVMYAGIFFEQDREAGNQILNIENLSFKIDIIIVSDINLNFDDKGNMFRLYSFSSFFKILNKELMPDSGSFDWGITTTQAYLPIDND